MQIGRVPLYVIIFAVISFVFFVLFYYIAERTYLKGVIGLSTSTVKEVISAEGLQKSTVQSSHLKAYVKKEFKTLFRTPQFFLNCIVQNFRYADYVVSSTFIRYKMGI